MYDRKWSSYRFRFLKHNPLCYLCESKATVVDHIVPHKGDESLFRKLDNHMPLCQMHHNIITGRFDHVEKVDLKAKAKYIAEERSISGVGRKIKVLTNY